MYQQTSMLDKIRRFKPTIPLRMYLAVQISITSKLRTINNDTQEIKNQQNRENTQKGLMKPTQM